MSSIEAFYKTYTPVSEQTGWLADEKRNLELFDPLPVYFVGKLGAAAREGVFAVNNKYVAEFGLSPETGALVSNEASHELTVIYFTTAVQSIYGLFTDNGRHCTYDAKYYNTLVNNMLTGTAIELYEPKDDKVDVYDGPKLITLGRAIQKDPTFASLFKAPYTYLPDSLKRDLGGKVLKAIEEVVVPPYETVAKILVEQEKAFRNGRKIPFEQGFSLKDIDSRVAELEALIQMRKAKKAA